MSGDERLNPKGIKPSTTNGDVMTTTAGVAGWAPAPIGVEDVVISVTNGVPYLMFDADGTPVTEG